jgi:hypothetical protein
MMQKVYILLLLVTLPYTALCIGKNKNILKGSWKEIRRTNVSNQPIAFTDTSFVEFNGEKFFWQKKGGYGFRGTYKMVDSMIDINRHVYDILDKSDTRILLKEDNMLYEFTPNVPAAAGAVATKKEEVYKPVSSIEAMTGHWSVYRSANSGPPASTIDYSRVIKGIVIEPQAVNGKWGTVAASKDPASNPSWYIERYANQILECNGKDKRTLKVIKCEEGELIVSDNNIVYYLKQFNR